MQTATSLLILSLSAAANAVGAPEESAPAAHAAQPRAATPSSSTAPASTTAESWAQANLQGWPPKTVALAVELVHKYGQPEETAARRVTWFRNGPWKRTSLLREGVQHNFPKSHLDVLEQTVDYKVPAEKIADLVTYNGSLVVDRTRGEITVHCDSEKQNILTLNIADDILRGERNLEQALAYHAQVIVGMRDGEPEPYPLKLRFKAPAADAPSANPGQEAPLLKHLGD